MNAHFAFLASMVYYSIAIGTPVLDMKVLFLGSSTNQNVIQLTYGYWEALQYIFHNLLENGGCIQMEVE